jgi:mRNA degradation ribonuclease J1/J2
MALEAETREYLDGDWRVSNPGMMALRIVGEDGDSILLCDASNAAHFLTHEAAAEYLLEQHSAAKRLAARERDIERAVLLLEMAEKSDKKVGRSRIRLAIEVLTKPEVTG